MKNKSGKGKFILGALVGAGAALLLAPQSGSETRKALKKKLSEMLDKIKEIDVKEVREDLERKIEQIKEDLKDLDKEKVLEIAKTKAKQIQEKAEELVDYAIEKGTPVLEKAATNIRNKAIVVTKEVLDKLENGNKKVKASK